MANLDISWVLCLLVYARAAYTTVQFGTPGRLPAPAFALMASKAQPDEIYAHVPDLHHGRSQSTRRNPISSRAVSMGCGQVGGVHWSAGEERSPERDSFRRSYAMRKGTSQNVPIVIHWMTDASGAYRIQKGRLRTTHKDLSSRR